MKLLQEAVNISPTSDESGSKCPMLYNKVGDKCVAFFSPARVPWAEARQLCKSLSGDLMWFEDEKSFLDVLKFLQAHQLTGDFWVGGRFSLDDNSWVWANCDSPMAEGVPFWALRYSTSSCWYRQLDAAGNALPGAPCFNYGLSPLKHEQGWCSAMTYELYHLMSDQPCSKELSPMCVLASPHASVSASDGSSSSCKGDCNTAQIKGEDQSVFALNVTEARP